MIDKIIEGLLLHPPAQREPRSVIRNSLEDLDIIGGDHQLRRGIEIEESRSESTERSSKIFGRRKPIGFSQTEHSRPNFRLEPSAPPVRTENHLVEDLDMVEEDVSHVTTARDKRGFALELTSHTWRRGDELPEGIIKAKNRLGIERDQILVVADNRESPFRRE